MVDMDVAAVETAAVEIMAAAIDLYGADGLAEAVRVITDSCYLDGLGERSQPYRCRCPRLGVWSAYGGAGLPMPAGHHWRWCNREHADGYLAHDPEPCHD